MNDYGCGHEGCPRKRCLCGNCICWEEMKDRMRAMGYASWFRPRPLTKDESGRYVWAEAEQ